MKKGNIVLIGMPGSGKSTTGVILAKTLNLLFLDTDIIIQQKENMSLQDIINKNGLEYFLKMEEKHTLDLSLEKHVIATGGSLIYSNSSLLHLRKKDGIIVYLELRFDEIEKQLKNISSRGIAIPKNKTLLDLYKERKPLYEKYSDIEINCSDKDIEDIIEEIKVRIEFY